MRDVLLGKTEEGKSLYLPAKVRTTHMHVIGASGTGKTKFLEHLIRADILENRGLALLDPTGNLYKELVRWCETKGFLGRKKILLFDPASDEWSFSFNPLSLSHESEDISFHVDSMVKACATVWGGEDTDRTPLLKRCLRSTFHVLAEKRLTLLEAMDLLSDTDQGGLRTYLTRDIRDAVIRAQWASFNSMRPREFRETFGSTQNRLMEFLASERIRRVLGARENALDLRSVMDEGAILLVNLSSGRRVSEENASLLGALIVSDLFLKARGRGKGSRPFFLYVDECSRFVSEDIGRILDEGRQFGLHLILAHQHLAQLMKAGEAVYNAVMTDARTKIVFGGLSPDDAKVMAETVYMGEIDFEEAKQSLVKPVTVGYERITLSNESESSGRSHGSGRSESDGWSDSRSQGRTMRQELLFFTEELSRNEGQTSLTSRSTSYSTNESSSWSRSSGWSEALMPIMQEMPTTVFSLEEQIHRAAAEIRNLRQRQAVVKIPERNSAVITVPPVSEGYARAQRVERFERETFRRSPFAASSAQVDERLAARRADLETQAQLAAQDQPIPEAPEDFLE